MVGAFRCFVFMWATFGLSAGKWLSVCVKSQCFGNMRYKCTITEAINLVTVMQSVGLMAPMKKNAYSSWENDKKESL